jgi:hypothetical protein
LLWVIERGPKSFAWWRWREAYHQIRTICPKRKSRIPVIVSFAGVARVEDFSSCVP